MTAVNRVYNPGITGLNGIAGLNAKTIVKRA